MLGQIVDGADLRVSALVTVSLQHVRHVAVCLQDLPDFGRVVQRIVRLIVDVLMDGHDRGLLSRAVEVGDQPGLLRHGNLGFGPDPRFHPPVITPIRGVVPVQHDEMNGADVEGVIVLLDGTIAVVQPLALVQRGFVVVAHHLVYRPPKFGDFGVQGIDIGDCPGGIGGGVTVDVIAEDQQESR